MKAYSYIQTSSDTVLPLSLEDAKIHLKIEDDDTDDDYITALIFSAGQFIEKYISQELITKTFKTYRDCFEDMFLHRRKVASIESIKYYVDNVLTTVLASRYSFTDENYKWSEIYLVESTDYWPTDSDIRPQAVEIIFTAGFGTADTDIPYDIKQAIQMIVAFLYENRGDCSDASLNNSFNNGILVSAKYILDKYRMIEI